MLYQKPVEPIEPIEPRRNSGRRAPTGCPVQNLSGETEDRANEIIAIALLPVALLLFFSTKEPYSLSVLSKKNCCIGRFLRVLRSRRNWRRRQLLERLCPRTKISASTKEDMVERPCHSRKVSAAIKENMIEIPYPRKDWRCEKRLIRTSLHLKLEWTKKALSCKTRRHVSRKDHEHSVQGEVYIKIDQNRSK